MWLMNLWTALVWVGMLATPTVAEGSATAWYQTRIESAKSACEETQSWLREAKDIEAGAKALAARAAPNDGAGRAAARQAAATAATAGSNNELASARVCGRLKRLRAGLANASGGSIVMPVYVRGTIIVMTPKGPAPWDGSSPLRAGEEIRTGKDGYAELVFPGSPAEVRLGPESAFTLQEDAFSLNRGRLYYFGEAAAEGLPKHRVILGGVISCTIRGTKFAAIVRGKEAARLALFEGEVAYSDPDTGQETVIRPGQHVVFKKGRLVEGPSAFDPAKTLEGWETLK